MPMSHSPKPLHYALFPMLCVPQSQALSDTTPFNYYLHFPYGETEAQRR